MGNEVIEQLDLKQMNVNDLDLKKLTKAQLVKILSDVIWQVNYFEKIVNDCNDSYRRSGIGYHQDFGSGVNLARELMIDRIFEFLK